MHLLSSDEQRRASEATEQQIRGSQAEPTVWLVIEGVEGPGLLAEMAQIIAKHGHDVKVRPGEGHASYQNLLDGKRGCRSLSEQDIAERHRQEGRSL